MSDLISHFTTINTRLVLAFAALVLANAILIFYCAKYNRMGSFLGLYIAINVAIIGVWAGTCWIDMDESEHLHCAWMVSRGLVPYKDFWQNHLPALWLALAPVFKSIQPTAFIFVISRCLSLLIFLVSLFLGWAVSKRVWGDKARFLVYALLLSLLFMIGKYIMIRPELPMMVFLLLSLYFCVRLEEDRDYHSFISGTMFSFAMSFSDKQFLMILVPIFMILYVNKRGIKRIFLYLLGVLAGALPLLAYLLKENILKDFFHWAIVFNIPFGFLRGGDPHVFAYILFFLISAALVFTYAIKRGPSSDIGPGFLMAYTAFLISLVPYLVRRRTFLFDLNFTFILFGILCSGAWNAKFRSKGPFGAINYIFLSIFLIYLSLSNFNIARHPFLVKDLFHNNIRNVGNILGFCRDEGCITQCPQHPIFAFDATGLYLHCQYKWMKSNEEMRKDFLAADIKNKIVQNRPPLIICKYRDSKNKFLDDLLKDGLLSEEDRAEIELFLDKEYEKVLYDGNQFYVRKDKL